jgi:hypothetical protein
MDDTEREAIRAEGLDPDDPAVVEALILARLESALHTIWTAKSFSALED